MTARTPIASTVPQPHGKPGGPGAFGMKGAQFPPYIQHVAGELLKKGKTKSQAYRMAIGIVRNWAHGHNRGHAVSPQVQSAAAKAIAQYDALRARAKATPNKGHEHTAARESVELAKPNLTDRSGMIALEVPKGTLPQMPGGLSNHHVTLAYLGDDVDDAGYAKAIKAAKHAASRHGPLAGQVGGIGAFPPGPDGTPVWATVDVPGLAELRHTLVQHMGGHASEHGFTPHATLSYVKPGQPMPKPLPPTNVKFGHVSVHRGDQVVRVPLGGGHEHTEGRMTVDLSNQVEWGRRYASRYARTRAGEPYVWSGHDDGGSLPVDLAKDYVEATRLKDGTPAPPGVMKTRGGHVVKKKPKLGTGARFKALVAKLEARGHSHESAVKIAAAIGRRKYGAKKMGALSHHHTAVRESVELAARNGRHIPGTDYNWRHGYIPLNAETAARWRKPWHGEGGHSGPHPKAKAGTGKAGTGEAPKTREERAAQKLKPGEFTVTQAKSGHWVVAGRNANGKPVGYRYQSIPKDNHIKPGVDLGEERAHKMAERLRADHAAAVKPKRQTKPRVPSQGALFGERKVRGKGPGGGEWDTGSTVTFTDADGNKHTGQVWSATDRNGEVFVVTGDRRVFRVGKMSRSGRQESTTPAKVGDEVQFRSRDHVNGGGRGRVVDVRPTGDRIVETDRGHRYRMNPKTGVTRREFGDAERVAAEQEKADRNRPLKPGESARGYLRSIGQTEDLARARDLEEAWRTSRSPQDAADVADEFAKIHPSLGEHYRAEAEQWRKSRVATAGLREAQKTPAQRLQERYDKALREGDTAALSRLASEVEKTRPSLAARIRRDAAAIRAKKAGGTAT